MDKQKLSCPGFKAAGLPSGIKPNGAPDLGLIFADRACQTAAVFTRNLVQAAPVRLSRRNLAEGVCRAVIVNSGNANCCTGQQGEEAAKRMCSAVADQFGIDPRQVLVASTGVIGEPLPVDKVVASVPRLAQSLSRQGFGQLARAIMTTDTRPKTGWREGEIEGKPFRIIGVAKGAGMIRPDLATMLCFVCTDVSIGHRLLQATLNAAVEASFNRITIDGDTSTNDTVVVMASGLSQARVDDSNQRVFKDLLSSLLYELALELVRDGEGVTKVVKVVVEGATSDDDARRVAETVAHSPLVKTAFFGQDANWGRIMGAAGRAGAEFKPDLVDIFFDDVKMVSRGTGCGPGAEARATEVLRRPEFSIKLDLHLGRGSWWMITSDLSVEYVKINADYRS